MFSINFSEFFLYLIAYGVLGWICEVIYCSIPARHFINRGFLKGPYCPIYGFGAIFVLALVEPVIYYPLLVFLLSLSIATILEYFTSWLMEELFQVRWWDYSHYKFNIRGRVCLKNSLLFGLMGLCAAYVMHPLVAGVISLIPKTRERVLASVIMAAFLVDLAFTLNHLLKFTERLKALQSYLNEIDQYNKEYAWLDRNDLAGSIGRLSEICRQDADNENLVHVLDRLESIVEKRQWKFRYLKSFPHMKPKGFDTIAMDLRNEWARRKERLIERKESAYQRVWGAITHVSSRTMTATKENAASFTSGTGFYKLFWVFVTASVLGYVVETIFCLATRGVIESRQGLLYGPFSQVYGLAAVIMVILLKPLAGKNDRWLFCGSALVGGAFEYFCSLAQEGVFGTVSWEYSANNFSIGGRTCLTYMLFWGILGVVFIKGVYPMLSDLIERIPSCQGLIFAWLLIILLTTDVFLSATAVYRWSKRDKGILPSNAYEQYLDRRYPDVFMEEIYPNMTMVK